jgi:hypothetical protein
MKDFESRTLTLSSELSKEKIDNEIQKHVLSFATPQKNALEDIIRYGRTVFKMDESRTPVALDARGYVIPGKDGTTPLTIEEWARDLPKEKPHFFVPSDGMGSEGGKHTSKGGKIDYSKIENPNERLRIYRENQAKSA